MRTLGNFHLGLSILPRKSFISQEFVQVCVSHVAGRVTNHHSHFFWDATVTWVNKLGLADGYSLTGFSYLNFLPFFPFDNVDYFMAKRGAKVWLKSCMAERFSINWCTWKHLQITLGRYVSVLTIWDFFFPLYYSREIILLILKITWCFFSLLGGFATFNYPDCVTYI